MARQVVKWQRRRRSGRTGGELAAQEAKWKDRRSSGSKCGEVA